MTRRLYLHLGPAKTGTSALQRAGAALSDRTLLYPVTGRWPDGAHHKLVFAAQGTRSHGTLAIEPLDRLREGLAAELAASEADVLISSELLSAKALASFEAAFGDILARHVDETARLFVVREPLGRAASLYNQIVKDPERREAMHPDAYLAAGIAPHNPSGMLASYRRIARPPQIISYHPAQSFVERAFARFGTAVTTGATVEANRSMGGAGLIGCLIGKRVTGSARAQRSYFEALRARLPLWRGASFPFSAAACADFAAAMEGPLEKLRRTSGIDLSGERRARARFVLTGEEVAAIEAAVTDLLGREAARDPDTRALLAEFSRPDPTAP